MQCSVFTTKLLLLLHFWAEMKPSQTDLVSEPEGQTLKVIGRRSVQRSTQCGMSCSNCLVFLSIV